MNYRERREVVCSWVPSRGGAWPWCDSCGVRADIHPGEPPVAEAVRRIVTRGEQS